VDEAASRAASRPKYCGSLTTAAALPRVGLGCAPPIDAIDNPTVGAGAKELVDTLAIRAWVERHNPSHAVIERAQAMPRQGASAGFKYGRAVGAIEAAVTLAVIRITIVRPRAWKKFHGLRGKEKGEGAEPAAGAATVSGRPPWPARRIMAGLRRR
jgi:hypothetical protein